jgi:hypothetical protein
MSRRCATKYGTWSNDRWLAEVNGAAPERLRWAALPPFAHGVKVMA